MPVTWLLPVTLSMQQMPVPSTLLTRFTFAKSYFCTSDVDPNDCNLFPCQCIRWWLDIWISYGASCEFNSGPVKQLSDLEIVELTFANPSAKKEEHQNMVYSSCWAEAWKFSISNKPALLPALHAAAQAYNSKKWQNRLLCCVGSSTDWHFLCLRCAVMNLDSMLPSPNIIIIHIILFLASVSWTFIAIWWRNCPM